MVFTRLRSIPLWLALLSHLIQIVMGWAFQVPRQIVEDTNAQFQVADDGGGFYYPYTMTVLKKVLGQPGQQVGLVYTNESTFYWNCNQLAGTVLEFQLVSKANVNVASSGNMTVLPGAEAAASSVSVQSVASTASLFSQTATQSYQTGSSGALPASSTPSGAGTENPKGVPVGVVAGVSIAGAVLLITLLVIAWWVYRSKRPKNTPESVFRQDDTITPFMHSQSHQQAPPMGYVNAYANPYEEPPQYAPPSQATSAWDPSATGYPSTTYASTSTPSEGTRTGDMSGRSGTYAPARYEKRRRQG